MDRYHLTKSQVATVVQKTKMVAAERNVAWGLDDGHYGPLDAGNNRLRHSRYYRGTKSA